MPAGVNTTVNIGVRRLIYTLPTPQYRNFEVNGTQIYTVAVSFVGAYTYTYAGNVYAKGAPIAYDQAGTYSNAAQLERDFNAGLINPIN